jgi:hypothetical protein
MNEAGQEGVLMPEIAGEAYAVDPVVDLSKRDDSLPRSVDAAVVHDDQFPIQLLPRQRQRDLLMEAREVLGLAIRRRDDRDQRAHRAGGVSRESHGMLERGHTTIIGEVLVRGR